MGLICAGEFSRLPSLVMLMNSENHGQISKLPVLLNLEEKLLLLGGMKLSTQHAKIIGKKSNPTLWWDQERVSTVGSQVEK